MWSWQYYPISTLQQNVLIQPRLFMFSRFLFYQQSFAVSRNNEKSYYISVYVKFACDKNPGNVDFIKKYSQTKYRLNYIMQYFRIYSIIFQNRNVSKPMIIICYRVYKCQKLFLVEMPIATQLDINKTNDVLFLSECVKEIR